MECGDQELRTAGKRPRKNMPKRVKEEHPDIDWKAMGGMRKSGHEYFGVRMGIIWKTIRESCLN